MTQNATNSFDGEHSQEPSPTPAQIQQMVQVGMDAAKLLGSPAYNLVYQQLLNTKFVQWMESQPKEERLRESLYYEAQALVAITEQLTAVAADGDRLLREQAAQQQNTDQEYLDTQGFGLNFGN